ncbi:MAG: thioredoxin domain-containing protein [Alphaproteobacteria bacterium]|nr:thioredoxin domain-containing protein [Alphaproteobacteria bacterium]
MQTKQTLITAVIAAIIGAGSAHFLPQQSAGTSDETIKAYLMANPSVIMDSVQKWQEDQRKAKTADATEALKDPEVQKALYENPNSPFIGSKDAKAVIVEFFDYNCPACKMAFKAIDELAKKDKDVKVIFKEFPIFGPVSETNSKIGLAVHALAPEKYFEFHSKMMGFEGRADEATALKFAAEVGLKEADVKAEIAKPEYQEKIETVRQLGTKIGVQGTPSLVIGNEFVPHALDFAGLEAKVAPLK